MRVRRSAFHNWSGQLGRLVWSYDIRNDPKWRKRKLRLHWSSGDFLTDLRRELEKVRRELPKHPPR